MLSIDVLNVIPAECAVNGRLGFSIELYLTLLLPIAGLLIVLMIAALVFLCHAPQPPETRRLRLSHLTRAEVCNLVFCACIPCPLAPFSDGVHPRAAPQSLAELCVWLQGFCCWCTLLSHARPFPPLIVCRTLGA